MTSRSRGLDPFGLNVEDKLHSEKDWSGLNFAGMIGLTNKVLVQRKISPLCCWESAWSPMKAMVVSCCKASEWKENGAVVVAAAAVVDVAVVVVVVDIAAEASLGTVAQFASGVSLKCQPSTLDWSGTCPLKVSAPIVTSCLRYLALDN